MSKYKNYLRVLLPLVLIITILLVLSITKTNQSTNTKITKFNIVCTTNIIEETLKNIIPESSSITITSLMGPGTDPHLYRATENDVSKLQKADLILYNGLHL